MGLFDHVTDTLRRFLVKQKKTALKNGYSLTEHVFANRKGNMLDRASFKNALDQCLASARLRHIRIHDLRHTYATIRLLKGHNIGDVSYQLGHASIKITYDIYGHWIPGKFKDEIDELDQEMGCKSAPYTHPK
jgi:integrase